MTICFLKFVMGITSESLTAQSEEVSIQISHGIHFCGPRKIKLRTNSELIQTDLLSTFKSCHKRKQSALSLAVNMRVKTQHGDRQDRTLMAKKSYVSLTAGVTSSLSSKS